MDGSLPAMNRSRKAFKAIAKILSDRADQLLTRIDILDIVNWLGTILVQPPFSADRPV